MNDSRYFHSYTPYRGQNKVHVGNGTGLTIAATGFAELISNNEPHTTFTLNDLIHVPAITHNLISASRFAADNNVFFELHPTECVVKSQSSRSPLLTDQVGAGGLYNLRTCKPISGTITKNKSTPSTSPLLLTSVTNDPVDHSCTTNVAP